MNEIDFALLVFLSSGAGIAVGRYLERKRAAVAFRNFSQAAMRNVSIVTQAAMTNLIKRSPGVEHKDLFQELLNECARQGMPVVGIDGQGNTLVRPDDNATK